MGLILLVFSDAPLSTQAQGNLATLARKPISYLHSRVMLLARHSIARQRSYSLNDERHPVRTLVGLLEGFVVASVDYRGRRQNPDVIVRGLK